MSQNSCLKPQQIVQLLSSGYGMVTVSEEGTYVCIYVFMYIYLYMYVYICMYVFIYMYLYEYINIFVP